MTHLFIASFLDAREFEIPLKSFTTRLSKSKIPEIFISDEEPLILAPGASITNTHDVPLSIIEAAASGMEPRQISIKAQEVIGTSKNITVSSKTLSDKSTFADVNHIAEEDPLNSFYTALAQLPKEEEKIDIFLYAHGTVIGGEHFITYKADRSCAKTHTLLRTKDLFKKIAETLPDTKVTLLFSSCFGGLSQLSKDELPKGSILYTLSGSDTVQAVTPINKTLECYPEGKDYSAETFIIQALANRGNHFAKERHMEQSTEIILVEVVSEIVVKGVSGEGKSERYQCDPLKLDKDKLKDAIGKFSKIVTNHDLELFLSKLYNAQQGFKLEEDIYTFLKDQHYLSLLAFLSDTKVDFSPDPKFTAFQSQTTSLPLCFDEYFTLFVRDDNATNFSKLGILDLLKSDYEILNLGVGGSKDKLNDALITKISGGKVENPFVNAQIICHIDRSHSDSNLFRVGLISDTGPNPLASLFTLKISKDDVLGLLSGEISSSYEFLLQHVEKRTECLALFTHSSLSLDLQQKVTSVSDSLDSLLRSLADDIKSKKDPLGRKLCKQIDKSLEEIQGFNSVACCEAASDADLLEKFSFFEMTHHNDHRSIFELGDLKYSCALKEFVE